ncbi:cytochrome c oxidase assembly protein [Aquibaculum arenosum]|uniref:Cytochrome c oxidase assembly protein n=1 Tax=Aquibaculum arenosum TaxID=3032591 RepID=A0ABT5YQD2_9PROT|nr:cytochrome c oxidase assembly protein [Fodinicurvata sp. CAU 1616]MDF2096940.1 cytochrome c oxidase assembly protein [Fodinicurvata sp. CAU 1616]
MGPSELFELCLASLPPVVPGTLWRAWVLAPETLVPLLALLALPWLPGLRARVGGGERWSWLLGCLLLAVSLVSPLCRLSATLASMHMVQHLLVILLAPAAMAPLLLRMRLPLPRPALTTLLFGGLIWLAHAPPIYQAALLSPTLHLLLLAASLGLALLFWCTALAAEPLRGMGMVFATMLHSGLLGALLTFSPRLWYPVFGSGPLAWGLTPLADQQLAGLIMWVPMALLLLLAGFWIAARGLRHQTLH